MPWYVNALIVVAVLVGPFVVGNYVARRLRMPDYGWKIGLVLCALLCGIVLVPPIGRPPKLGIDLSGGVILVYEVDKTKRQDDEGVQMDKLIAAVSRRVNPTGVKEVTIRQYGPDQIEIIIPEVNKEEADRIKKTISRAGTLEFRILASTRKDAALIEQARIEASRTVKDPADGMVLGWWVPVQPGEERNLTGDAYADIVTRPKKLGDRSLTEVFVLKDTFDVTGFFLERAMSDYDERLQPCVGFIFNSRGGHLFAGLTGNNLPDPVQVEKTRKLGIILDGNLYSAPAIKTTIHERGEITGSFTPEEVEDLVNVLNAGSLPAALTEEPISELQTGPRLGQDTIDKGRLAIGAALVIIPVFMAIYYRFAGLVACGAILTNLLLTLAMMIAIKAAITLPGLAGLVLSVGMAVDANVLIFERMREELERGAALRMAIRNGFARALSAIVDSNLVTLITATVLYVIGTDQVRGFAVVLWLGIVISMFTAVFCSRVVFDIAEKQRWITRLSMLKMLSTTNIDFLGKSRLAITGSLVLILAGLVAVAMRGEGLLDIDFTGGVSVEVVFKPDHPQEVGEVRSRLSGLPDLAVSDVQLTDEPKGLRFVVNTSQPDQVDPNDPSRVEKRAIEVVEELIRERFRGELATSAMTIETLETITGQPKAQGAEQGKPAAQQPSAQPEPSQSRSDLPEDSVWAMAGLSARAMAEDESAAPQQPAAEASADAQPMPPAPEATAQPAAGQSPEKAPSPGTAPTEPKAKEGEEVADPYAGGTEARLKFHDNMPVGHDTLMDIFYQEFGSRDAAPPIDAVSSDPGYQPDDGKSYATWEVKIKLPRDQARSQLESIQKRLADTPFFPSSNTIGGAVAGEARTKAVGALAVSVLATIVYLWVRFQKVAFGLAAVLAVVHDVLVILGMIALSYYFSLLPGVQSVLLVDPFKIGLPVLTAFLTIIGYSLNDTIVIFDRLREIRGKTPRLTEEMVNRSVNQTLSRTLLTGGTTLATVLILYVVGGQGIHGFAFAMLIGSIVGIYSTIYIASPLLLWMSRAGESP